jgi:carboxymethylenebutenolidase
MGEYVTINVADGSFRAFVERPSAERSPCVVVLHEVFGVNDDMRATCRELAERGLIAIAPDLFWRQEPGLDLSHWTEAEWQKGLSLYQAYDRDQGARDIAEVLAFARTINGANGKVGVMGFCLGGLMTFLVTARTGADASVAYYPGSADEYVAEAQNVATPMIVHLGEEDEFITKDAQAAILQAFASNPHVDVFSYPGCSHAFARHSGTHYDADAASLANGRTWAFLARHLT